MLDDIAVSVLLVAYNQEEYVAQALDCILSQQVDFPFEVLVHDDCSTDGTLAVIEGYRERHPDVIRVFSETENQYGKVAGGYFSGLLAPHARGTYLALCEGDDYWCDPHKLQRQYDYMQAHPTCTECIHAALRLDMATGEEEVAGFGQYARNLTAADVIAEWNMATASRFIRKSALEGYIERWTFERPAGDFPLAVYVASQGYVRYDPRVACVYRFRRPGSWSEQSLSSEGHVRNAHRWIRMLQDIDEATSGAYHVAIMHPTGHYARIVQSEEGEDGLTAFAEEALAFPPYDFEGALRRSLTATALATLSEFATHGASVFSRRASALVNRLAAEPSDQHAGCDERYDAWFRKRRTPSSSPALIAMARELEEREGAPLFSIVVPLYETPISLFEDMVESVRAQAYRLWELMLVNASPGNEPLSHAVERAQAADFRIRVVELEANRGITLNTREGVQQATGDFVCFLDHDDVIEPDLLLEYAHAIVSQTDVDVLYCDEDKLTPDGVFVEPYFKPDFAIDYLRSNNYVCHMLTLRTSLLRSLPAQSRDCDGAQDHDLTLMAVEVARRVHHVPRVLYHWRMNATSSSGNTGNKAYAIQASIRALRAHFEREHLVTRVQRGPCDLTYRVDYEVVGNPLVSVVIPAIACDDASLARCIKTLLNVGDYEHFEVIIVCGENSSCEAERDSASNALRRASCQDDAFNDTRVRMVTCDTASPDFATLLNHGCAQAQGECLVALSPNAEINDPHWMSLLLGMFQRDDLGAAGPRLVSPDGMIVCSGIGIAGGRVHYLSRFLPHNTPGYFSTQQVIRNVSALPPDCLMTPRALFEHVGGFDPSMGSLASVDYCLKTQAIGKLVVFNPFAEVTCRDSSWKHMPQLLSPRTNRDLKRLRKRWPEIFETGDPYLNPNLSGKSPFALK